MIADRWGVRDAEVARAYPCDEYVPAPALSAWRGVSVAAPPAELWPWVAQIRAAPYSYDWIDNLGRRSPRRLLGLPDPVPGEPFTRILGRIPAGEVLAAEPEVHYSGRIAGAVMSYLLVPNGTSTRLLMKLMMARGRRLGPLILTGDLVMARRQLLTLAALAEGGGRPAEGGGRPADGSCPGPARV
ncbi:hypothetical protein [Conexibacter sp. DBS9H8]|uniref:hypothetical protein n=1 Tax=Conexibacter sp. DBS9H8 TaxID=2937801 RepID=UPI00200BF28E|nr:hypothetical protein [Conexibacter sp. DBS9H8]